MTKGVRQASPLHILLASALAVGLCAFGASGSASAEGPTATTDRVTSGVSVSATEFTLANGVRVVVIPDHRVPVVTHMVWYAVGARDEAADQHGIAHYLEHMMFKGTTTYPKGEFDRFVMRRGGSHNAVTNMDHTYYYQRLPKPALRTLMAMEADRMRNLRIEDADVASERSVVLEEFRRSETSVSTALDKAMQAWLYGTNPKGRSTIGTEAEIRAMSGATAQNFYEQYYGPQRATVVIAGDVSEAEARILAEDTYGKVVPRQDLKIRAQTELPATVEARRLVMSHERATAVRVNRTYLMAGMDRTSRQDISAANLFGYIAGGGITSRLHRRLVNEAAIAIGVNCNFAASQGASTLDCSAAGGVGVSADVLEKRFTDAIDELAVGGVTDEEFDEIKNRFLSTSVYRRDNVFNRAMAYASSVADGLSLADVEALETDVERLTKADVERVGRAILTTTRNVTGVLTPRVPATAAVVPGAAN